MQIQTTGPVRPVGAIFFFVGLGLLGGAYWAGQRQQTIIKSWPAVDADVTKSEVIRYRDSDGDTLYRAEIEFRFTVNGKEYVTSASPGYGTSMRSQMQKKVDKYAPGTRHSIRYNPSDPNDVRFDVGYSPGFFFLPLLLGGMGLVFTILGAVLFRAGRAEP